MLSRFFHLASGIERTNWRRLLATADGHRAFPTALLFSTSHRVVCQYLLLWGRPYLDDVDIIIMPEDCQQESTIGLPSVIQTHDGDKSVQEENPEENWQSSSDCATAAQWWHGTAIKRVDTERELPQSCKSHAWSCGYASRTRWRTRATCLFLRPEDSLHYERKTATDSEIYHALSQSSYDGTELRLVIHEKYERDGRWIVTRMTNFGIAVELFWPIGRKF